MTDALIDSSVFAEYYRAKYPKPGRDATEKNPEEFLNGVSIPYVCPVIIQEVMQGFLKHEWTKGDTDLLSYDIIELDPKKAAVEAAKVYRKLRATGYTMKNGNDCLIAVHAMAAGVPVLTKDGDFVEIAKHFDLEILKV